MASFSDLLAKYGPFRIATYADELSPYYIEVVLRPIKQEYSDRYWIACLRGNRIEDIQGPMYRPDYQKETKDEQV